MKKVLITGATSGIMKKFIDKYILVKQLKLECIKIEINNLNSITKVINKSINSNSNKLIYRASLIQFIPIKLYNIIKF